jgi:signal transduction histidine kinase
MEPAAIGLSLAALAALAALATERVRLRRRNAELQALLAAGLDIGDVRPLDEVLQQVVDLATNLLGARWGALAVNAVDGSIRSFLTAGLTPEQRQVIGNPPSGRGLLGVPLKEGQSLVVADIPADARSVGFPPNHPPMASLLAVPISCRTEFRGILYVADARRRQFSQADVPLLTKFARQAAIAIDNSTLQERVGHLATIAERMRVGRELHDHVAQLLASCNAQLLAVHEHLSAGRVDTALAQIERLAKLTREVYADSREQILALRSPGALDRPFVATLTGWVTTWSQQSGIEVMVEVDEQIELGSANELQLLRIAQEALSNVRKHARASRACLVLRRVPRGAELLVDDDGLGLDPEAPQAREGIPRFGLATMRERAEALGGELAIESAELGGARIRVSVPLKETAS